ncbi:hypothetical protein K432DRAFT_441457 [Lepidopterella palustris CBS 459.81]|uniref:Extracellular membrane protein CFEM domain-containing protein n=1 Tax=Lepidopterella palustris CBS 459.81 TaxID=1314670 RepID=A0A8E2JHM3_9PEZI|nr:hypothetical protein K432DRAFT_441457 [Lepidopterella palustris CBS 459.81]
MAAPIDHDSLSILCAELPVSNIVRGMASGCGDGGQTTSFTCFCSDSSSQFVNIISTAVQSKCSSADGAANQALDVFASYCRLQVSNTAVAASATVSGSASTAIIATAAVSSSTAPSETAAASSSNNDAGMKVAVGICIPLAAIGVAVGVYFYLRGRRANQEGIALPMDSQGRPNMPQPPATSHSTQPFSFGPMPTYSKYEYDSSKAASFQSHEMTPRSTNWTWGHNQAPLAEMHVPSRPTEMA